MRIFIEPLEPLMFRTGRPFEAGAYNFAESLFPPTPETIQGALRAALAVHWGESQKPPMRDMGKIFRHDTLLEWIGDRSSYGRFRVTGITLGRRDETEKVERLFSAPAHIIRAKAKYEGESEFQDRLIQSLPHQQSDSRLTNLPPGYPTLLLPRKKPNIDGKASNLSGWLTAKGLSAVLYGDDVYESKEEWGSDVIKEEWIYTRESRLGIMMENRKKATKEGFLYQAQVIRLRPNYGFVVDIAFGKKENSTSEMSVAEELLDVPKDFFLPQEGWLTIGGEQRAARFQVLSEGQNVSEDGVKSGVTGNLLYFATPAYFKKGWLPEDDGLLPATPLTAAILRYQPIGGWSLVPGTASGEAKVTRRCVPAGSVYFFDKPITVKRPITEYGWQIGYGITYVGDWN